ncbi:MAG: NPCBM/NEW2 domain-containing protein [Gemmataceae bacterium]
MNDRFKGKQAALGKSRRKQSKAGARLWLEQLEAKVAPSTLPIGFQDTTVFQGVRGPTKQVFTPDGRLFVAEKVTGNVVIIQNGVKFAQPLLTVPVDVYRDHGIVGLALDPNFATNGYLYVYYTKADPANPNTEGNAAADRLSRFHISSANPNTTDPEQVLLDNIIASPHGIHDGGAMAFGADGMLYLGVGEGDNTPADAQDLSKLNGKILRLNVAAFNPNNPNSLIPSTNPFVGQANARGEIFAYGFRNPFSGAMRPGTNQFFINDVGPDIWEEVNVGVPGGNFGWPLFQGVSNDPTLVNPFYTYPHNSSGGGAVTGGTFYTATQFPVEYQGQYFFADYVNHFIRTLNPVTGQVQDFGTDLGGPVDLAVASDGSLCYANINNGSIHKIQFVGYPNRAPTAVATCDVTSGYAPLSVNFSGTNSSDPDGDSLIYSWDFGDGTTATGSTVNHIYTVNGTYQAVLTVTDRGDGSGFTATAAPLTVTVGNLAPVATITAPTSSLKYHGGDTVIFAGTGSDFEDGALPASAFHWSFAFGHNTHFHNFIPPIDGVTGGSFVVPTFGENDPDQYYRINLTVTDSSGLQNTMTVDIRPVTANLILTSNVAGAFVTLDGQTVTTPASITSVAGMTRTLVAPAMQTVAGVAYGFNLWSDFGSGTHNITVPSSDTTYSALYRPLGVPLFVSDLPWLQAINGYTTPVRRNTNSGGGVLKLNGQAYSKGLGVVSPSQVRYSLNGNYTLFTADIGVDDAVGSNGSVVFQVWADGIKLYDSGLMQGDTATKRVSVDVAGRNELLLITTDGGDNNWFDSANWANAILYSNFVSDRPWLDAVNGYSTSVTKNTSNGGAVLTLNGQTYNKGLGVVSPSQVRYALNGNYSLFSADVGVDDEVGSNGSVVFQVWADGVKLYEGGVMTGLSPTQHVSVDVTGRNELLLVTTTGGNNNWFDSADWANAQLQPDRTAPTVGSVSPAAGATAVPITTSPISIVMSEPLDPISVTTTTITLMKQGTNISLPSTITYDRASRTVRLQPSANLKTGSVYVATIKGGPNGVRDSVGNTLAADVVWTFTTVFPTVSINAPLTGLEGAPIAVSAVVSGPNPNYTSAWSVTKNGTTFATGSASSFGFTPNDNGSYVVTVTTTDDDNTTASDSKTINVSNVAPIPSFVAATVIRGQSTSFTISASDASTIDAAAGFTYFVSWGDGSSDTVTASPGNAAGVPLSHTYANSGIFSVQVSARDKDLDQGTVTTLLTVAAAAVIGGDLWVAGTSGPDSITLNPTNANGTSIGVTINGASFGTFVTSPSSRVFVYGYSGNDTIRVVSGTVSGSTVPFSRPALLFGDDGNDTLDTLASTSWGVLIGGAGNDTITSGVGRTLAIAGMGSNRITTGAGSDIVIGGYTDFDANRTALLAMMAEWTRTDIDYATRVGHLRGSAGGLNAGFVLTLDTVHDNGTSDILNAGQGVDWLLYHKTGSNKDTTDVTNGETETLL